MNAAPHPLKTTLTLLLVAEGQQKHHDSFDDAVSTVIESLFSEWGDERKADLYALLADRVQHDMPIGKMEEVVQRCLWDNQNHWEGRL